MSQISTPFPLFTEADGSPLDAGYIYIGIENLNPETNPLTIYWDSTSLIPAAQPLRTMDGYIYRSGALANAYTTASAYSMTVKDRFGALIYYLPSVKPSGGGSIGTSGVQSVATLGAVRNLDKSTASPSVVTAGYYAIGDGGGARYYLDASDNISVDDGGAVIVATDGGRWKLIESGEVSARQFGARGNSSYSVLAADDTTALQNFINYLQKAGRRGRIPAGRYRCTSQLNITDSCDIYGDGWKDVRDMTTNISPNSRDWTQSAVTGTILYADFFTSVAQQQIYITGNSVRISQIEFEVNQPPPNATTWSPNPVPLAIYAFRNNYYEQGGNSLTLEDIMIRNHTNGIKLFGVARGYLNNIYGQCFGVAIDVSHNGDVFRANNIHFNWSFFSGLKATNDYMDQNCTILLLGRVDNPIVSNFFTFGGLVGIRFYVDTITPDGGSTFRLQGSNIGLDNIAIGILLTDACSASFTNLYVFNRSNATDSRGIHSRQVLGGGYVPCRLNLVNCDFEGSNAEAIRLETPGSCNMSNVQITNYNNSGGAYPAVAAYDGVSIQYANLSNTTPSTTPLTQTYGTGSISGGAGGGGSGVTTWNSRTGSVTMTSTDVTNAFVLAGRLLDNGGTFRSTQTSTFSTGVGMEMNYDSALSVGFLNSFNRSTNLYADMGIGGRNITFRNQSGNVGSWDSSGNLIILNPPAAADDSNKVPTTGWVRSYVAGGSGGAVTSFNTRSGAVVLTSADMLAALTTTPVTFSQAGTFRSTSSITPASGVGIEMNYDTSLSVGFLNCFNRSTNLYGDMGIGGRNITFRNQAGNVGSWDASGNLIILSAPASSDNSNKVPTTAWVRTFVAGGTGTGLTSFQGRTTPAAVLTSADVTGALGYTPASLSSPSFSGVVGNVGTFRSTSTTNPGSGAGVEVNYNSSSSAGFVNSFDRSASTYKDLSIGGATLTFTNNTAGTHSACLPNGNWTLGKLTDSGAYKLQVNGQIFATSATIATSDGRLKENIELLGDATAIIEALIPVTFDFKPHEELEFPQGTQVGFIAQEVQVALGDAAYRGSVVSTGAEYLGVAESKLVPLLVKALQESNARIAHLESLLAV